jgi:hypothetical protein
MAMKTLFSLLLFSVSIFAFSQDSHVYIKGAVENETKEKIMGCNLQLFQDDRLIKTDTTGPSGMFKFDSLAVGHTYDLYFESAGYSLKFVRIDVTKADPKDLTRFPLEINMALFSTEGLNMEKLSFLQSEPYAIARYNKTIDNIEWDTVYLEKMKKKVDAVRQ